MKKLLSWLLAGAVLAPAVLSAASFEGKVNFKMTSARGKPQEMRYSIKGDKIRIELPGQKEMGGLIMDTTKKETTVLMDEQQMYMVMAMPAAAPTQQTAKAGEETKLEKTGEKEKILGYLAEKFVATDQKSKTELWLAEGLGSFIGASSAGPMGGKPGSGPAPQAWERALAGKDLFPLRVVTRDQGGKENFRLEATEIEKQTLSAALFAPPPGYQKLDMGGMMQGMPGIPGLPGRRP